MAPEHYIRPPLVAEEPSSRRAAVWRFRAVVIVLALAIAAALAVVLLHAVNGNGENPGIGGDPQGLARIPAAAPLTPL